MFTRQHYQAIAGMIAKHDRLDDEGYKTPMGFFADEMADYFASDNPRFDREKFLAACRGEYDSDGVPSIPGHSIGPNGPR